ncbi:uracil-DNA glycosylase family protein [Halarcobacter anaerophilus]|uniref:uracil-DNA glycosylase family protein n=1 Tax=Halarcobacter anaerophilus TaxID=877500 RepID=UPI0005C8DAB9|nr:uracil-DNA glycosylase family protein [Halarcobacter anaerophilus]
MFSHFHPFKPFLNKDTKAIIVGTLPPPRFCTKEYKKEDVLFCYGSKDNLLWQVIDKIYKLNLPFDNTNEAVSKREEFLKEYKIGICDIVDSCKREKIDASDLGMKDVKLRDILWFLKEYKDIKTLIFTGSYSKNSPEYFFRQVLKENKIEYKAVDNNTPKINFFIYDNRAFQTISLTSPSNAANRYIGSNKLYKERKEKNSAYNTFDFRFEQYEKVFKAL